MPISTQQYLTSGLEQFVHQVFTEQGLHDPRVDIHQDPFRVALEIRVSVQGIGPQAQSYAVHRMIDQRMLLQDLGEGAAVVNRVVHEMARQLQRTIDAEAAARINIVPEVNPPEGYAWNMNSDTYEQAITRMTTLEPPKPKKQPKRKTLWQHILED